MEDHLASIGPARPLVELAAEITELAGHLNAANHRWLRLIAEFDRREGWSDGLTQSCAHWLNWKCGLNMGAAREKVRVAHALEGLPKISNAMASGQISYSKVRAMTRVARPETEDLLLMIALHGTAAHVEKLVNVYRRNEAQEVSREARQHAARGLSYYYDADGSLVFKGRLPADVGAALVKAIDIATGSLFKVTAETSEPHQSFAARRADSLGKIAESFLQHGLESMTGGDKHQIVVHVSAETLRDSVEGQCELEHGPSLAAETVRRLSCDASVVMIAENEKGEVLNVGRKTRSISPALRRMLHARDKGCRFPGCSNTKFVDAHHIHHWAQGGETKPSNLVTLCRFHHRKVHEGGIGIRVLDDGAVRFVKSNGESIDSLMPGTTPPLTNWVKLQHIHQHEGVSIDADTAVTRWRGESMDYSTAVTSMFYKRNKARDVSAEMSGGGRG